MVAKRYSPITIVFNIWSYIKNMFLIALLLFVFRAGSESLFVSIGRYVFLMVTIAMFIYYILKWLTEKYVLDEAAFHLYKGVFNQSERTIPYAKIQNVNRHTSFLHRLLKATSLHFETGIAGEDAKITFAAVSLKEVAVIEVHVEKAAHLSGEIQAESSESNQNEYERAQHQHSERTVHFTPTKRELMKASFTSLSFLLLIPIIGSIYFRIDDVFHVEDQAEGIFTQLFSSWFVIALVLIGLVIASVAFGMVRTFLTYGKYEISSDEERIYIAKGIIDETAFSITKNKVQAIELNQSLMKRILGLVEVKLISAGNLELEDDKLEVSVLYPFLPVKRAYELVTEILPSYEMTETMQRLPKKSLWVRLLRPSWLWLIVTAGLVYFRPPIADIKQAWWIIPIVYLFILVVVRVLDYANTRYVMNDVFIQFKTGSFATTLFLSKREKVIEVSKTQSLYQKWFGLASIHTINRAKPVHHEGVDDIPLPLAEEFFTWYVGRKNEVFVE